MIDLDRLPVPPEIHVAEKRDAAALNSGGKVVVVRRHLVASLRLAQPVLSRTADMDGEQRAVGQRDVQTGSVCPDAVPVTERCVTANAAYVGQRRSGDGER